MDFIEQINEYYEREKKAIDALDRDELNAAMNALLEAYERGATVYVFGNGGSSATASHMVCDFNKGTCFELEKKFKFVCLNDNVPLMMAISNDYSFENIFEYQLKDRLTKDDLILAISGSGNSHNVVKAVEYAKRMKDRGVGFRIHYICGTMGSSMADVGRLKRDVAGSDLVILDLMGADGRYMMAATPALESSPAQRIVISRMGPVASRLGGFDPEASKADADDAAAVELFSELYRRCSPGDFGNAMDMVLRRYFGRTDILEPPPFG